MNSKQVQTQQKKTFDQYKSKLQQKKITQKILTQSKSALKQMKNSQNQFTNTNSKIKSGKRQLKPLHDDSSQNRKNKRSPNRHSHCNHSPAKNVSYLQLEQILNTIQIVKGKAKQQIENLTLKNNSLQKDLRQSLLKNTNYDRQINELNNKTSLLQKKFQGLQIEKKIQLQRYQLEIEKLITQNKNKNNIITNLQKQLKQKQHQNIHLLTSLDKQIKTKQQYQVKYNNLVNILTKNKNQRLSELLYQIKQNYQSKSVLDILKHFQKQILIHQKQKQQLLSDKSKLQQLVQIEKKRTQVQCQRNIVNQQLNRRITQQSKNKQEQQKQIQDELNKEIQQLRTKISNLSVTLYNQQNLNSQIKTIHIQSTKTLSTQLQIKTTELININQQNQQLKQTIIILQRKIQKIQEAQKVKNRESKYFQLLQKECQQINDLDNILTRLQMLQKCKAENHTNIQKIQFLCKMLDN